MGLDKIRELVLKKLLLQERYDKIRMLCQLFESDHLIVDVSSIKLDENLICRNPFYYPGYVFSERLGGN